MLYWKGNFVQFKSKIEGTAMSEEVKNIEKKEVHVSLENGKEMAFPVYRVHRESVCSMQGGTRITSLQENINATQALALHYLLTTSHVAVNVGSLKNDPILKEEIENIAGTRVELSAEEVDLVFDRAFARLESLKK